jgi:dTDP-4-dehydrorhamnose reductase
MRVLILGATGMLGHKMWQRLRARFPDAFATMRGRREDFAHCGLFDTDHVIDRLDVLDVSALARTLEKIRPDAIVNCIAVTKRREQSDDPLASIELNAALPHRLARWSSSNGARLIHFSTDCVFDGCTGNYDESSLTNAADLYGRTKTLGEVERAGALTLRTSLVGRELKEKTELLEWFLSQRGKRIRGFRQVLYTGVSTVWMTDLVADILERFPDLSGIYQVASPVVSKLDLLRYARDAFDVDVDIEPDDSIVMKRNLNGGRFASATGISVPDWKSMMAALAADPTPYDAWSAANAI